MAFTLASFLQHPTNHYLVLLRVSIYVDICFSINPVYCVLPLEPHLSMDGVNRVMLPVAGVVVSRLSCGDRVEVGGRPGLSRVSASQSAITITSPVTPLTPHLHHMLHTMPG